MIRPEIKKALELAAITGLTVEESEALKVYVLTRVAKDQETAEEGNENPATGEIA